MATETNVQQGPSDTNMPAGSQAPGSSGEPQAVISSLQNGHRALEVARRHPALTVAGAATLGLFGGFEVAAGIVIGAAMLALLREGRERAAPGAAAPGAAAPGAAAPGAAATHRVRDRARELWSDLPHTVRERTRAVIQAARGKPVDHRASASTPSAD